MRMPAIMINDGSALRDVCADYLRLFCQTDNKIYLFRYFKMLNRAKDVQEAAALAKLVSKNPKAINAWIEVNIDLIQNHESEITPIALFGVVLGTLQVATCKQITNIPLLAKLIISIVLPNEECWRPVRAFPRQFESKGQIDRYFFCLKESISLCHHKVLSEVVRGVHGALPPEKDIREINVVGCCVLKELENLSHLTPNCPEEVIILYKTLHSRIHF